MKLLCTIFAAVAFLSLRASCPTPNIVIFLSGDISFLDTTPCGAADASRLAAAHARHHGFAEQRGGVAGLLVGFVVIVGALDASVCQRGFDLGDLGGGQVEEAIDDFVDVTLDPLDCGSVGVCGCLGGTFREFCEFGFIGGGGSISRSPPRVGFLPG